MINKKSALSRKVLTTTGSILLTGTASLHAHPEELEETTILANRTETPISKVGNSVSTLNADELKKQGVFYLDDALKFIPGVISESTGGQRGSISSLFLRGTGTNKTQLRVDGMRASGPNILSGNFLGAANLNSVSRVEILKGPQGAIYGGDTIGGVVGIYTEKGTEFHQGSTTLEAGSFNSLKSSATQKGRFDKLYYSFSINYEETENDLPNNSFDQESYNLRLDYELDDHSIIGFTLRSSESSFDRPDYTDPAYSFASNDNTDSLISTLFADIKVNEQWQSKLTLGFYNEEFSSASFGYEGEKRAAYWDNTITWSEEHTSIAGLVYENIQYNDDTGEQYGVYLNHSWAATEALTLNGGLRWEDYDSYGDEVTWRVASAYNIDTTNTKLRASVGKGFRPPSFYERYGDNGIYTFANADLEAEESLGWDIGVDQEFNEGQYKLSATYFQNKIKDTIIYLSPDYVTSFTGVYGNSESTITTSGFEFEASASWLNDRLDTTLSYTYLDKSMSDQPRHSAGLRVNGYITDKLASGVSFNYVDSRSFGRNDLDSYLTANTYASYEINDNLKINARVENLFDHNYDLFSSNGFNGLERFPARGRGLFAGLTYTW